MKKICPFRTIAHGYTYDQTCRLDECELWIGKAVGGACAIRITALNIKEIKNETSKESES